MADPASNTRDCFTEFTGQRLVGALFGRERPAHTRDDHRILADLIFEDGRALTICANGSYWITRADDIRAAARQIADRLQRVQSELDEALRLAGVTDG